MIGQQALRDEYLRRVCGALVEYCDRGYGLRVHSDYKHGRLSVTFDLESADTFHALAEGRPIPSAGTPNPLPARDRVPES